MHDEGCLSVPGPVVHVDVEKALLLPSCFSKIQPDYEVHNNRGVPVQVFVAKARD